MTTSASDTKEQLRKLLHEVAEAANEALVKFDNPRLVGARCVDIDSAAVEMMHLLEISGGLG